MGTLIHHLLSFSSSSSHTPSLSALLLLPTKYPPPKCSPIKTQKENKKQTIQACSSFFSHFPLEDSFPGVSSSSTETALHKVTSEWHLCCSVPFQSSYCFIWSIWQLPPSLATMLCLLVLFSHFWLLHPIFSQQTLTEPLLPVTWDVNKATQTAALTELKAGSAAFAWPLNISVPLGSHLWSHVFLMLYSLAE